MSDDQDNVSPFRKNSRPSDDPIGEVKRLIKDFFGGGNGNGGRNRSNGSGGGSQFTPTNPNKWIGVVALVILVAWGVMSSVYTIDVSEEGVITRFGAYERTSPSGMHFKLPYGIESVIKVQSKRVLQEEFGFRTREIRSGAAATSYDKNQYAQESLMLTGDLNVADVEWILQYRISDPWKFLFHARDPQRNIRDISMSIMRRIVGDRLVGGVLTTGRVEIADQAKILTQEVLNVYDMGIMIERVILQGVNPPEKVKPAFNEVNAAKQEQERTINNAEREYNRVIPEARGQAERIVTDAEGYALDIVNRAKGNVAQFEEVLKAYRRAPEITRRRLYIDTMEEILANGDKFTVIDKNLKGVLPIYALPELAKPAAQIPKP